MHTYLRFGLVVAFGAAQAFSAVAVTKAREGILEKIDNASKTIVVKTADGAEHTFHFLGRTAVHGVEAAAKGTTETLHGLKEGSEVVVHYSTRGTEDTAEEIDHIGKGGLKTTEGTVKTIDRGAKTMTIKAADGSEQTFRLADHAARDSGQEIGKGAEKSEKVTVYYTEEAGHKLAHFFKKL